MCASERRGAGMSPFILVGVERLFESGQDKTLHQARGTALHAVLDDASGLAVMDWGQTDDENPHEYVELAIALAGGAFSLMLPVAKSLAQKLLEKAVDRTSSEAIAWVFERLKGKQDG